MKFTDYLNQCLENPEFRKYWEEETTQANEEFTIDEVSQELNEDDLNNMTEISIC